MIRPTIQKTLLATAFLLAASPAFAGTLQYQNGQTSWEPTTCTAPAAPTFMGTNSDRSGNALSANVEAYNQYSAAVQAFLTCVSGEANQDLANISAQIGGQVQQVQGAWQQELAKKNAELQGQRSR